MKNFRLGLFGYMVKKVGMKCMPDAPANAPSEKPTDIYSAFLKQSKAGNGAEYLKNASPADRTVILFKIDALDGGSIANKKWREAMRKEIARLSTPVALKPLSPVALASTIIVAANPVLEDNQTKENGQAVDQAEKAKTAIVAKTKIDVADVKDSIDTKNYIRLLADLDGKDDIGDKVKDFVTEKNLQKALSHADANAGGLDEVYKRVVGTAPDWKKPKETAKQFQEALRVSVSIIGQLTAGNAGLNAFLEGKTETFFEAVQKKVKANNGKPLEVRLDNSTALSPTMHNILGAVATAGVAIVTGGMVTVGHEKHEMNAEDFMKEVKSGTEKTLGNKTLSVLNYIKEAFMGRKLSITFGRERVADYVKSITTYTETVMSLKGDTDPKNIQDPELQKAFTMAMNAAKSMKIDLTTHFDAIQKTLIQSYIVGEGFKNEGSNWSASIGILMLAGVHRDEISYDVAKTTSSEYTKIEKKNMNHKVSEKTYAGHGINIEKKDGQWIYEIPKEIQLSGDITMIPVKHTVEPNKEGKYIYTQEASQNVTFSENDSGEYEIVFTPATTETPVVTQAVKQIINLRERETDLHKSVADILYSMGHDKQFNPLVRLLALQDFSGATALLEKKFPKLANRLLRTKDSIDMSTWTSYMYGSSKSRAKQAYTQTYADKEVRTKATISSEARLAKQLKISAPVNEAALQVAKNERYTPTQASVLFPEQAMTIASFATPKGGLHRLDTYDGSVTMSNKRVEIIDTNEKLSVINAILANTETTKGIRHQLDSLNAFTKGNITIEQYVSYLTTGDLSKLGTPGLALQKDKEPRVFEGRAMIAGNVCLNRLYGIVYPAFMFGGVKQEVAPAVSFEYSTLLNVVKVDTLQNVAGVGIAGVINHLTKTEVPPKNPTTTPGEIVTGPVNQGGTPIVTTPINIGNTGTTGFIPH